MGGKRSAAWKRLLVPAALLILASGYGCSVLQHSAKGERCDHLERVEGYLKRGDFDGAMKASQNMLARSPNSPPGDEALMNMGLISAHYANPKRDYNKAMAYFMRLEREFPSSPLVDEAKVWVSVLQSFEKAKQVDIEIERKKKELGK